MRRTPLKRGGGFRRPELAPRSKPKLFPVGQAGVVAVMRRADEAANEICSIPKQPREENAHYRAMAAGKPCLLRVDGACCGDWSTTVLAHSNRLADNKGKALKAHDHAGVWACFGCHSWLDQGRAPRAGKDLAFDRGMERMRVELRLIASDPRTKERDRVAAEWALERMRVS